MKYWRATIGPKQTRVSLLVMALCLAVTGTGCSVARPPELPREIIVDSAPSGANITINDINLGQTPVAVENIPQGRQLVVLTRDGFKRTAKLINITDHRRQRFIIEMDPLVGHISIETKPSGAKIYLDGFEYLGDTPVIHKEVPVGKHKYDIRKDDYKNELADVTVEADFTYSFVHELTPREGRVSIFSRPSGARIWINDEPIKDPTPAKVELAAGDYTIKLYSKGYLTAEQNVTLEANQDQNVEIDLKPGDAPFGMILVPAGKFIMGLNGASPDERPQREIDLPAFYIDKTEVTNGQFKQVYPNHFFPKGKAQEPVTNISFNQATEYARAVGKRLPTEEEWEKAARGSDGREYPWGVDFKQELCNFSGTSLNAPTKTNSYRLGTSPYGCADMAGNVYEWTSSWYQAYPGNADVNVQYGQIFRVLRGGSFQSDRFGVRCARRHYDRMDATRPDYGFRCAKDVESTSPAVP